MNPSTRVAAPPTNQQTRTQEVRADQPIRPPKQQRSRESYERVLDAAYALLEDNGFDGFTIQEVAARANVSVGAIYERFGNKETLLRTVHDRLMLAIAEVADSEPSADELTDPHAVIRAWVKQVSATMASYRAGLRAFMHLGALDPVISQRGSQESVALSRSFKEALRPYSASFRQADPDVALDVAFRMTYSTLARQVMYGPVFESDIEIDWDRLTAELAQACAAYLLG